MLGKIFLITGATSGIGLGLSKTLIDEGALVIGIGRNPSGLNELLKGGYSGKMVFISFDLLELNNIEKLIEEVIEKYGKIDGFVHCAGIDEIIPLAGYKVEKIKRIYEINLFSGIELLRVISKKKNSNDYGSYIFLSSVMGNLGQYGKTGYCSTKSAMLGVVKSAALELSKRKIRVNAVLPGIVISPLTDKLFDSISEENVNKIKEMHPLGIGNIEDVVPLIMFLLSENSKWITGQSLVIDGGYSIQ